MTLRLTITSLATLTLIVAIASLSGCSEAERPITIAFSNDMVGEIRSCGCASKDYGGLGRRATFLAGQRGRSDNFLLLEGGDFFGLDVNYGEEKAGLTLEAMAYVQYDAIAPGEMEFAFGIDYLQERAEALKLPIVAANVFHAESGEQVFPSSRIVELADGTTVGIVGAVGDKLRMPRNARDEVRVDPPLPAVQEAVAALVESVDIIVMVAHMPVNEARRLAREVPELQLIACGHEGRPMRNIKKIGNAYVLQVPNEGKYMGLVTGTLEDNQIVGLRGDPVPMSKRFADDEAMVKLFRSYDLSIVNIEKQRAGAVGAADIPVIKAFGGAEACKDCHSEAYEKWYESPHAHAFDVLVEAGRDFDRDCTPCHSTGFHSLGGFVNALTTPELTDIQCEACHGNGHDHLKDESVLPETDARAVCTTCHTKDQTPDFEFKEFWERGGH